MVCTHELRVQASPSPPSGCGVVVTYELAMLGTRVRSSPTAPIYVNN